MGATACARRSPAYYLQAHYHTAHYHASVHATARLAGSLASNLTSTSNRLIAIEPRLPRLGDAVVVNDEASAVAPRGRLVRPPRDACPLLPGASVQRPNHFFLNVEEAARSNIWACWVAEAHH